MSKINVDTWEPESGTTITAGASGDTLAISADSVTGFKVGSDAAGDVLYNDGTDYTRLAKPGTPTGDVLTFATSATAPSWVAPVAQTFRETSNHTNGAATCVIGATNYEEADQAGYSSLGGITESAGVFTFPSTGRYLVMSVVQSSQALAVFAYSHIQYSSNSGVAWTSQSESIVKFTTTALSKNNIAHAVVDIADISTDRVQIEYSSSSSVNTIYGSDTQNLTYTTLIKLA